MTNINQQQRLAQQRDNLQAEWDLRTEKLKRLRQALAIENSPDVQFKLQQQIQAEETELKRLEQELYKIEQALSKTNSGNLTNVPELPPHFLPREQELAPLKQKVLSQTKQPVAITGKSRRVGVQGMGGIGKTVLATALARDEEVRKAFPDGVFWITVGQTPQILTWQSYIASALGDLQAAFTEVGLAKARLRELFAEKTCLLILDDTWCLDDATAFDVLGERCQMLITTRDAAIVTGLGGEEYQLGVLGEQQALALLADWVNQPLEELPTTAQEVAKQCGYLPLALSLNGAMVRDGTPWSDLLEALREADLEFFEHPHGSILKSIKISIEALPEQAAQNYLQLAVFPEDTPVPEAAIVKIWTYSNRLTERNARKLLTTLARKALLRTTGEAPQRQIELHDLQYLYLRGAVSNLPALHAQLLNAYSEKYPQGWHSLENDGYIWENLAYHLLAGGRERELEQLLCDFRWLQAKLENININALIADYDFLPEDENLQLIQGALQLSAHILNQDKQQLAGQLLGRLLGFAREEIQRLLTQAHQCKICGLLPQIASLTPPGGPLVRTLVGHSSSVNAISLSADGLYAISGSGDNTLKVWNWQTGELLRTLVGHSYPVKAVALTRDGKYVISAAEDYTLKVWNWQTGELLRTLVGHSYSVRAIALSADGLYAISGSDDYTLKVWNWQTGELLRTLVDHSDSVRAIALSADGLYAISASHDSTLKVWDWQTGQQLRTLEGHSDSVNAIALSADGKYAISGSHDSTLKVWNWQTGELLRTLVGHSRAVNAIALSADGKYAISGSHESTLKVWNWQTGELLRTLVGHSYLVRAIALSADGKYAISASGDRTLKVWDWQTGEQLRTLVGHSYPVKAVALTKDGKYVISAADDYTLKVWNWQTGQQLRTLVGHSRAVNAIALSADDKYAISASSDSTLKVWDWQTGQQLRTLEGHSDSVNAIALSADDKYAISASHDNTLKVWDWQTGQQLRTLEGHSNSVNAIALSADGLYAISGSDDYTLKVWNWQTGELLRTLVGHSRAVNAIALSADGLYAISVSHESTLKVRNWQTGELMRTLKDHSDVVRAIALSADGLYAISGSDDRILKVWNWQTGEVIASFTGESSIYCCAIASDGVKVVAGDASGRVHFLRLHSTKE
ncbi:WD repeat protein [Calothrix sp. NIES-2100]|uniref:NB-ARC domain-containing protein n=1 Tax=Calothrix sp. NIES-2100 TaxID=1954172 RepID=UPI000B5E44BA|nr:WD repeat protein [Calothrix sp. NIES-2100]